MSKDTNTEKELTKETARFNYRISEQKATETGRFKEVSSRFQKEDNLKDFPFKSFPLNQRIQYAEQLADLRVLTFANKDTYDADNLDALYPHSLTETEVFLFQKAEYGWLHLQYQFCDLVAYNHDRSSEQHILELGHAVASFSNPYYEKLEELIFNLPPQQIIYKNKPDYLLQYASFAYSVVDTILAKFLFLPANTTDFFSQLEQHLEDIKKLRSSKADLAPSITLEEGMRFYKEYLKWKYKVAEDLHVFNTAMKLCDKLPATFVSENLSEPCETELQAIKLAQQTWSATDLTLFKIKSRSITRTTISLIRGLIERISSEGLAALDTTKPITWLGLAFLIESRQTLPLQRRTRRKENDNRNGIQEYSIASYIKHWIDLGKESPKPKRTTPQFSFDKMHRYIIQFAVCSDMKCRKLDEVYGQNRVLLEKAGQVLEQVFLYYNYDSAVTSISQFIQDIHNFYWAYLDEHVGIKITIPIP